MKSFTIVFSILIIATNITIISECLEYATQRDFFERYKDYFYTNLDYKEIIGDNGLPIENYDSVLMKSSKMKETFYQKYFEQFNPIILVYFGKIENYDMIFANINATNYLFDVIPELENKVSCEGYYYIIPKEIKNLTDVCNKIDMWTENYEDKNILKDRKIILYSGRKKVLNIDEFAINGSKYCLNPIIVLNTIRPIYNPDTIKSYIFKTNYEHDIMYKIDEKVFNQFVEKNDLKNHFHALTNIFEKYEYNWFVLKRVLYINLIFSLLILLLEFIIIKTIINLEFKINAMSLSIKKVLGYSYLQRYKQIILISTIGSFICIIVGTIIGAYTGINSTLSIVTGGIIIYVLDMLVIYFAIKKSEKANILNVLKGDYI